MSDADRWLVYLGSLEERGSTAAQATTVRALWQLIEARFSGDVPLPIVTGSDDGSLNLAWNTGDRYVDFEVYPSGLVDWFWINPDLKAHAGSEDASPLDQIGTEVETCMAQLTR